MGVGVAPMTQDLGPAAGLASDRTAQGPAGSSPVGSAQQSPHRAHTGSSAHQGCVPRGHRARGQSPTVPSAAAAVPIVSSGLAAAASSPSPRGDVY